MDEQAYLDMMDNASRWNGLLLRDRSDRLPFYDAQTGISQIDCRHLWHKESERFPGQRLDQVFSYPAPRWKWIRRPKFIPADEVAANTAEVINDFETPATAKGNTVDVGKTNPVEWSEMDSFFQEDDVPEPEDEEDDDYYDDSYKKRRRKAGVSPSAGGPYSSRRSGRRQPTEEDALKPFVCDTCGLGYKTKPGLHYHLMKAHPAASAAAPVAAATDFAKPADRPANRQSNICDVCHLDVLPSPKTGQPEELIFCSDCGKSGHPSCLQFTDNMVISVKKYKWQCIDCKACAVCGTSENDDQLLFCDDCDRGYHMYCLDPPLAEPPEGSWSCRLCLDEFNENASSVVNNRPPSTAQVAASEAAPEARTDDQSQTTEEIAQTTTVPPLVSEEQPAEKKEDPPSQSATEPSETEPTS